MDNHPEYFGNRWVHISDMLTRTSRYGNNSNLYNNNLITYIAQTCIHKMIKCAMLH